MKNENQADDDQLHPQHQQVETAAVL